MSLKASRYLRRTNAVTDEMSSPASREDISRTEPVNSKRRRVLKTGDLIHFNLDSPTEERKKVVSRTKSVDEDTPQKKSVKTPFRSVRKVKTSVAADSSRKKRKSLVLIHGSKGENTDLKNIENSVSTNKTINFDTESPLYEVESVNTPLFEKKTQKKVKSTFRSLGKNKNITDSNVALSSNKSKLRRSVNNNTQNIRCRLSALFKSSCSDAGAAVTDNTNVVLITASPKAESPLVDNTQKRKSTESPVAISNKKIKTGITPNFDVSYTTKGRNSVLVHQSLILKGTSPLVVGHAEKIKSSHVHSQIEEKNVFIHQKPSARKSLPVEEAKPQRKIVRAKRLLNHASNQLRGNESTVSTVSEVQTSLKKKRRTWQRQENFDMDSFCEYINDNAKQKEVEVIEASGEKDRTVDNCDAEGDKQNKTEVVQENSDGEKDKSLLPNHEESCSKDNSTRKKIEIIEIIDLVTESSFCMEHDGEEQNKVEETFVVEELEKNEEKVSVAECKQTVNSTFELVVTVIEDPISPSTSNPEPQRLEKSLSPIANLHFDTSEEEIRPSTSGLAPENASRRRTYELETSINDVSVLKTMSEQDSVRINSFSSGGKDLPFSEAEMTRSKVTLRRKFDKSDEDFFNSRISKIPPPWLTTEDVDNEDRSSPETSTPMPTLKGRFTLLKEVLTKEKPTVSDFKCGINFNGSTKVSSSLVTDRNTDFQNSTNKKKQIPHALFKNVSTKKHGSNVKVPNFAAIHKRALDKIENISDYKKRKEERAQMLLSGKKPPVSQTPKKQTKKQLRFDANTSDKPKPSDFIPLPSTPLPKRTYNESLDSTITPVQVRVPQFNFVVSKENLFPMTGRILTPRLKEKGAKSNSNDVQLKVLTPKNNNSNQKMGVFRFGNNGNRFGFNMAKPVVMKKEEIKAMVTTKSKVVKNMVESRRNMIKGVRSNRRFELLMNMRKGK